MGKRRKKIETMRRQPFHYLGHEKKKRYHLEIRGILLEFVCLHNEISFIR